MRNNRTGRNNSRRKNKLFLMIVLLIFCGFLLSTNLAAQTLIKNYLNCPAGSVAFGTDIPTPAAFQ